MVTRFLWPLLCLVLCTAVTEADGSHPLTRRSSGGDGQIDQGSQIYRGTWRSSSTGHAGPMRARVMPRGDGNYDARFSGRFLLVIPFTYRVSMTTVGYSAAGQTLSAHKQLGPLLGSYDMTTQVTPGGMWGNFRAAGDDGSISMRRLR